MDSSHGFPEQTYGIDPIGMLRTPIEDFRYQMSQIGIYWIDPIGVLNIPMRLIQKVCITQDICGIDPIDVLRTSFGLPP